MRKSVYGTLIFIGILLLILPVSVPIVKTSAKYSMFNTRWDGCSNFAKLLHARGEVIPVMYSYNTVGLGNFKGVLVIVHPDIQFSRLEALEVKKFLENGGTVFIADNFGSSNSLLNYLGLKVKFYTAPLKDVFYSKNINFPVVVRIENSTLSAGVSYVVLNVPSAISGGKGVILSSKVSSIGEFTLKPKSYPILEQIKYGRGRIILLSDPGLLTNSMYEKDKTFITNLIKYIGGNTFYFDEAHHSDFNPYSVATVYIHRTLDRKKAFEVFVAVSTLAIIVEGGLLRKILNLILKLKSILPERNVELFEDLPDWVDVKLFESMIQEIKIGSKLSKLGDVDGNRWSGIYKKSEKRS